jgi:protein O-mannosyl-transferase
LFFLLSVMSYVKYAAVRAQRNIDSVDPEATIPTDAGTRPHLRRYYFLSFAYFVLALSGKPAVVTAPAVFLLLDWYPFGRIRTWRDLVSTVLEKLPFAVVSIVLSLVTMASQKALAASDAWDRSFLAAQAMLSVEAFITYLWRILYPLHLLPFYPFPEDMTSLSLRALFLMVIGVSLTMTALFLARRRPVITVAWFFYLVTILPTLGMVGIRSSFMADRYMYLPSLGPFIFVGMIAARPWNESEAKESEHVAAKRIVLSAGAAIGIILLILTNQQISIWKNSITLWSHVIAIEPNRIPIAYNNRGLAFKESGQRERALDDYEKALALSPSAKTYTNRGILYAEAGDMEKALDDLNKAIDLDTSYADAYTSRGLVYLHNEFPEQAIKDFDRALQMKPESADAWLNRGLAYEQRGELFQAAGDYTKAIELNPYDHLAFTYRGAVFSKMGRFGEAVDDQTMSITLEPDFAAAYLGRGHGYREMGKKSMALQDYQRACDLGADDGCMAMRALLDGK